MLKAALSMEPWLHGDDLFMAGDSKLENEVLMNIRKGFQVGSEDKNDILFVGQRLLWYKDEKYGS